MYSKGNKCVVASVGNYSRSELSASEPPSYDSCRGADPLEARLYSVGPDDEASLRELFIFRTCLPEGSKRSSDEVAGSSSSEPTASKLGEAGDEE